MLVIMIGRRPSRSLSLPQNGEAMNWPSEYMQNSRLVTCREAPKCVA